MDMEITMQCLVPDFQQPVDCVDFSTRLHQQLVCLECVTSSDLGLSGTIQVLNVAFEKQLEKCIDDATRKNNFQLLEQFLQTEDCDIISHKCSKQFFNKFDKLICRLVHDTNSEDYDLQVAITEALCRMTSEKQRGELACQWFSMEFVTNAFKGIKDSEFETLQIPLDENLEEFWIDFNVGSRSISFYVAADDEDQQWETVSIPEEEVEMYSLEERESKKLLTIILKNPVTVGNQEGEQMFLYFDPVLKIMEVVRKVYGANKCKGFTKKQATSVAKTSVHIIFDESGSQVLVPESQLSPCLKEKSGMEGKSNKSVKQKLPVQQRNQNKKTNKENCKNIQSKITTPIKRKVSEASVIVPGTGGLPLRSPLVFVNTSTPRKARFKLPLQMMSSSEKNNINRITESGTKNLDLEHTGPHISSIADSLKRNPDESKSILQKKVDNKNRTNKNMKHLFSDTDTECRGDDSKTDISWLRESNRKPKPQLVDYSRTKNLKKSKSIEATDTFPDPACLMDISEGKKTKNKKVPVSKKQNAKADERIKQTTRPKWPRRAALAKKSYKDYSNSESESEQESSQCLCRKEKLRVQQEHKNGQNKAVNQHKELQNNVSTEPKKGISRNQQKMFTKSKDPMKQRKLEMCYGLISSIKCLYLLGAEKVPEEAFTQEHVSLKRSTSSYLQDSTPEKRESLSIVKGISANKLYTTKKNNQSIHPKQSPENVRKLVFGNESLSPVLSPLSLPSLTPVTMDKAVLSGKDIEVTEPEVEICDISEAVNVTNYLSDKLSIDTELKNLTKNMKNRGEESVPPSQLCTSSGSREQSWCEDPCGTIHESGPTVQVNLKRMYHNDAESDSDEAEMRKEEEERKTKLLPRKLFKADDDTVYKVSESISTVSVNELSVLDGEVWDPGCSSVGIGQKLHKEFTRKIQMHLMKEDMKGLQEKLLKEMNMYIMDTGNNVPSETMTVMQIFKDI
ncbi:Synaptonemal complex protein 2 [Chelonia mydas]|uniref:Synaptonemal complex protein 2 n=1 Tax=Chelonia mydas TaxID=8469 RepID=M7BF69_CHEMY|nr:Synaptonemal complex protein 2 [Chelonia mydas]